MASDELIKLKNYHIFSFCDKHFAFDPVGVQLFILDSDEVTLLNQFKRGTVDVSEGHVGAVLARLVQNGVWRSDLAKEHPRGDRIEVLVNATQDCNLSCAYCFVDRGRFAYGDKRVRVLSPQLAAKLIETLPHAVPWAKEYSIHFYGGEPLLNLAAIKAAVDAACRSPYRYTFSVTTNGTVCTAEALSILLKGRFNIILSIDGPAYVHDAVRRTSSGTPSHSNVLQFLKKVHEAGLWVRGSSVVRAGWSLAEAFAYLNTLELDAIKAQAVRVPAGHPLALTASDLQAYEKDLQDIAADVIDCLLKGRKPKDDRFNSRVLQVLCHVRRHSFCGAGLNIVGMACDGTMFPCVLQAGDDDLALGNIADLDGAWSLRGMRWAEERRLRDECKECWALPLCGGGCPAMLSVCGEDECSIVRINCELALAIYGSFDQKEDLLQLGDASLAGVL